jgi:hypothetical protein
LPARAVPAVRRHIRRFAQRDPDLARRLACGECLLGGVVPELDEHQIAQQRAAVALAEFLGDGSPEFAQPHRRAFRVRKRTPRTQAGAFNVVESADREIRVEVRDEVVGNRVWDDIETFDHRKAVTDFAHDH